MENDTSVADDMVKTLSRMAGSLNSLGARLTNQNTSRRKSIVYFNDLKQKEDKKDQPEEDNDEDDYETMKMKIQMMNKDEVTNQINEFIFSRDPEAQGKRIGQNENMFAKTRYANPNSFANFFEKYRISDKLVRKGISISTPSFNLIKSLKENFLVPNPVGLVKRDGADNTLHLK
jgi:hypothetical protein